MDFIKLKTTVGKAFEKYKYVWIVLVIGMVMMTIPTKPNNEEDRMPQSSCTEYTADISSQLECILCRISGAGDVKVMLTILHGERTIYQTDSMYTQSENDTDSRTETVLITDNQRNETGLIHQKNPPTYQGAIILAQGADVPAVKLAIVNAVSNVTGLGADKITVLKMK